MPFADIETRRAYQRIWIAGRRAAWLKGKSCVACGSSDDLEIHHCDPTQKVSHRIWSWSALRRDAELAKCEVRCGSCHLLVREPGHGTVGRYAQGCRCDPCREAKSAYRVSWRRRRSSVGRAPA